MLYKNLDKVKTHSDKDLRHVTRYAVHNTIICGH